MLFRSLSFPDMSHDPITGNVTETDFVCKLLRGDPDGRCHSVWAACSDPSLCWLLQLLMETMPFLVKVLRKKHAWREGGYRGCLILTRKPRMASLGIFTFGCTGSSLLNELSPVGGSGGATLWCGVQASHCSGFFYCRAQALGCEELISCCTRAQ